jgi:hypothetical protein
MRESNANYRQQAGKPSYSGQSEHRSSRGGTFLRSPKRPPDKDARSGPEHVHESVFAIDACRRGTTARGSFRTADDAEDSGRNGDGAQERHSGEKSRSFPRADHDSRLRVPLSDSIGSRRFSEGRSMVR